MAEKLKAPVCVHLPTALQDIAGVDQVELSGTTVAEVIDQLNLRHPGLRDKLLTPEGELRTLVNVFYGEDNIRDLDGMATTVRGGTLSIIAAVAGG